MDKCHTHHHTTQIPNQQIPHEPEYHRIIWEKISLVNINSEIKVMRLRVSSDDGKYKNMEKNMQ